MREAFETETPASDLGYCNICLRKWVTEAGKYHMMFAASSQDIRDTVTIVSDKVGSLCKNLKMCDTHGLIRRNDI